MVASISSPYGGVAMTSCGLPVTCLTVTPSATISRQIVEHGYLGVLRFVATPSGFVDIAQCRNMNQFDGFNAPAARREDPPIGSPYMVRSLAAEGFGSTEMWS